MMNTLRAVVRNKQIILLENMDIPEGTPILVTLLTEIDDSRFWKEASEVSLKKVWDNPEDDIYAELLKK